MVKMCIRDRPSTAADIPHHIPRLVSEHHLDQNIAGINLPLNLAGFIILYPVSYTHLDVYKRQALYCAQYCL